MDYEDGDLVLCRVTEVGKTAISIVLEDNEKVDGTIPISEIAPGRIRNLRDYVVPNKRIVCKVLKVNPTGSLVLSLRRVSIKEMKEVLEEKKRERTSMKILEIVLGDEKQSKELYLKITQTEGKKLRDFFEEAKSNKSLLTKYLDSDKIEKLIKIISEKKEKEKEIKKDISLKTRKPEGVVDIKKILSNLDCEVSYIAGGRYSLKIKTTDFKEASNRLSSYILAIEKAAKEKGIDFQSFEK